MNFWLNDLRWLLLSPKVLNASFPAFNGLLVDFSEDQRSRIVEWLDHLRSNSNAQQKLEHWMASKPPKSISRLGRYAEHLVEFFLREGPTHHLVAANLQIKAQPQAGQAKDFTTQGELDFLLTDEQNQPWHWEMAVKYFVCRDVTNPTLFDLIGPDSAENFAHKVEKLVVKQLSNKAPSPHAGVAWKPAALACGWMFYRRGRVVPTITELSSGHCRGTWINLDELEDLADDHNASKSGFILLPRQRWLSPMQCSVSDGFPVLSWQALTETINEQWRSQTALHRAEGGALIARMISSDKSKDALQEAERFFVMPNSWPGYASKT